MPIPRQALGSGTRVLTKYSGIFYWVSSLNLNHSGGMRSGYCRCRSLNLSREHIVTARFDTESLHDQRGKCRAAAEMARIFRDRGAGAGRFAGGRTADGETAAVEPGAGEAAAVGHPCDDPLCGEEFARILAGEPRVSTGDHRSSGLPDLPRDRPA